MDQLSAQTSPPRGRRPHRLQRRPCERISLLGATMDLVRSSEVFHFVAGRLAAGRKTVIANHNLHSLHLIRKDREVGAFFDLADLVEVDSVPLLAWARLIGGRGRRFHRCTYLDWRDEFWSLAEQHGWRVFFVGGRPGVAETAAETIRAEWPAVTLDTRHGYFDIEPGAAESATLLTEIERFEPDILLVGMGMPRQEVWVARNYAALPVCAVFTVGGAFDYEAGAQVPCPRWLGAIGLEWLFRLATSPRLLSRYLIEPWSLVVPALADLRRAAARDRDARPPAQSPQAG